MSTTEVTDKNAENPSAHDHDHEGHEHHHHHAPALNPECTREVSLDIPAPEVSKAYKSITANYRKYARIPGFRPGKVPESVIARRFAAEIRKDVIDFLLPERFNQAVRELGVAPVGQPQVTELTVEDGKPLHVKALFEYVPEFSVEGYDTVKVDKPSDAVSDEEYNTELEQLRESRATIEPVEEDRPLKDGDWAQISYTGDVQAAEGEEAAPPVTGEDALVEIGGKTTLPAFNEALRGSKAGQELKVEVVYPADYQEPKLAGKTVAYSVTVKAIKKRVLPVLDDEFAKEIGNFENLAALETRVREYLTSRKSASIEDDTRNRLFAALAEKFAFPVPESLIQQQIDTRLERGLRALAQQGMTEEQMKRLDFNRLRAAQRDGATAEVKGALILDKIAAAENVTVSEDEVDREVQMAALQSREPVEELHKRLTEDGGLARIRETLKREKMAHLLYERLPVTA